MLHFFCPVSKALPSTALLVALCACGGAPPPVEEPGPTEPATDEMSAGTDSAATPSALPESYNPGHGETAFGVYLATVAEGDTEHAPRLLAELEARGVTGGGSGQLSCDQGAAAALGEDDGAIAVSVSFRTRAEAEAFVAAWGFPVLGVAEFVAYCRD